MAYSVATLVQKDPAGADGRVRIVVAFSGDAGEPPMRRERYVGAETLADLQAWARAEAAAHGGRKSIADSLTLGATFDLTPPAPRAPTAAEVWLSKASRLQRAKAFGLTVQKAVDDLAALEADVNATYVTGYL